MAPVSSTATTGFSTEPVMTHPEVSDSPVSGEEGLCIDTPIRHRKSLWNQPKQLLSEPAKCNPAVGLSYLKNYPTIQSPRLLVDGVLLRKEKGIDKYEAREPGCLDTLVDGWSYIINKLKELPAGKKPEINPTFISELHRRVAAHYQKCNPGEFLSSSDSGFYYIPLTHSDFTDECYCDDDGFVEAEALHSKHLSLFDERDYKATAFNLRFIINKKRIDVNLPAGIAEKLYKNRFNFHAVKKILKELSEDNTQAGYQLVQKAFKKAISEFETYKGSRIATATTAEEKSDILLTKFSNCILNKFGLYVHRKTPPIRNNHKLLPLILDSLNVQLMNCQNREQLIDVICYHISELEQVHPFKSVNGRTFTLLMQYLLMAYELPPATFDMPENLLLCSHKQQVWEVEKAIRTSMELIVYGQDIDIGILGFKAQSDNQLYRRISDRMACIIK